MIGTTRRYKLSVSVAAELTQVWGGGSGGWVGEKKRERRRETLADKKYRNLV